MPGPSPGGLNRTSVGLKRRMARSAASVHRLPQSNQRGIETESSYSCTVSNITCLNRTSVGLKPIWAAMEAASKAAASIEPAWD